MSLISTLSHPDAESYESVSYADTYFTKHPDGSRWTALTTTQKESFLKHASEILDTSYAFTKNKAKLLASGPWEQRFRLPASDHVTFAGTATSGSTTTLVCNDLTNVDDYRDDYFNDGTLRLTSGNNIYHLSKISDFDVATGTITVETEFDNSISADIEFMIIMPLPANMRNAVCEMALEVVKGDWQAAINAAVLANGNAVPSNLLPAKVLWLLQAQNQVYAKVRRT